MPTLPLYLPAGVVPADASHRVTSPGGYEQWVFEASSPDADVRLVAVFFDGRSLNSRYARRYRRYRRWPTRFQPPVPQEYPAVHTLLIEGAHVVARSTTDFPAGACTASTETLEVRIGPNHAIRDAERNIHVALSGAIAAELEFRPVAAAAPIVSSVASRGGEHFEITGHSPFDVRGDIRLCDPGRVIPFVGRGTHAHRFGTAPQYLAFTSAVY